MKSLLDLLSEMESLGGREALLYDDGYRTHRSSYRELLARISGAAKELRERGVGPGEILHHRAVHDRGIAPGLGHDPAGHAGNGRLAAGPADGHAGPRRVEQRRQQLGPAHARAAEFLRAHHLGHGVLDRGRRDKRLRRRCDSTAVLREEGKAQALQPAELFGRAALVAAAVRSADLGAVPFEDQRQRVILLLPALTSNV